MLQLLSAVDRTLAQLESPLFKIDFKEAKVISCNRLFSWRLVAILFPIASLMRNALESIAVQNAT